MGSFFCKFPRRLAQTWVRFVIFTFFGPSPLPLAPPPTGCAPVFHPEFLSGPDRAPSLTMASPFSFVPRLLGYSASCRLRHSDCHPAKPIGTPIPLSTSKFDTTPCDRLAGFTKSPDGRSPVKISRGTFDHTLMEASPYHNAPRSPVGQSLQIIGFSDAEFLLISCSDEPAGNLPARNGRDSRPGRPRDIVLSTVP